MNDDHLLEAKSEAKRFLAKIAALEAEAKAGHHGGHYACPERAAVLRSSMDLTRSLAKLRRIGR